MDESFSTRPVVGRLIALDLRPTRPITFLGPAWAALCGAIAAGGLAWRSQSFLFVILSILLCDTLLGAWRALWLHADWRAALPRNLAQARVWLNLGRDDQPGSFLARALKPLTLRLAFARNVIWPLVDSEIIGMVIAGILAVCLAALMTPVTLMLVGGTMGLALLEGELSAERRMGLRALIEIAMPWLITQSVFGYFSWLSLVFALLFTLVYRALLGVVVARQEHWLRWSFLPQLGIALLLFAEATPVGAAIVALGLIAQVLWQTRYRINRDGRAYAQHVQAYVLVAMLVAGLALWF